jgi:hypothetical protein
MEGETIMIPWWAQLIAGLTAIAGVCGTALRVIWKMDDRSHKRATCKCDKCSFIRRVEAMRKDAHIAKTRAAQSALSRTNKADHTGHKIITPTPDDVNAAYMPTTLLDVDYMVGYHGHQYKVRERKVDYVKNRYDIRLLNMRTHVEFVVHIAFSMADLRVWKLMSPPPGIKVTPLRAACRVIGHWWLRDNTCERPGCRAVTSGREHKCVWCTASFDVEKDLGIHLNVHHRNAD